VVEGVVKVLVKKWGNSAAVRIPAAVLAAAGLRVDQPVDVREEQGRIIVEPILAEALDLAMLVAGITNENRHDAIEMGSAAGQEVW